MILDSNRMLAFVKVIQYDVKSDDMILLQIFLQLKFFFM